MKWIRSIHTTMLKHFILLHKGLVTIQYDTCLTVSRGPSALLRQKVDGILSTKRWKLFFFLLQFPPPLHAPPSPHHQSGGGGTAVLNWFNRFLLLPKLIDFKTLVLFKGLSASSNFSFLQKGSTRVGWNMLFFSRWYTGRYTIFREKNYDFLKFDRAFSLIIHYSCALLL